MGEAMRAAAVEKYLNVAKMNADRYRVDRPYHLVASPPPYVVSELGLTVHRVLGVRRGQNSELAVFECGEATFYPRYFKRRPTRPKGRWTRHCKRCGL